VASILQAQTRITQLQQSQTNLGQLKENWTAATRLCSKPFKT